MPSAVQTVKLMLDKGQALATFQSVGSFSFLGFSAKPQKIVSLEL
jgi:hypothetical protein